MPGNELARQIKERLTARQVVEFYGFHPNRSGYIQCPFHQGDNHGSLKVYEGNKSGWHCFGCGSGGSVIDFVMRLFSIRFAQACLKLNCDFGLGIVPGKKQTRAEQSAILEARRREAQEKAAAEKMYREKVAEYRYWWEVQKTFAPDAVGYIHPLYAEAVKRLPALEYWLDQNIGR